MTGMAGITGMTGPTGMIGPTGPSPLLASAMYSRKVQDVSGSVLVNINNLYVDSDSGFTVSNTSSTYTNLPANTAVLSLKFINQW
jgi:hypothetical protein